MFDKLLRCNHSCDNGRNLQELCEEVIEEVLNHLRTATDTAPGWAKSWHHWGLFNLALLGHHAAARDAAKAQAHVAPAVVGFFRSVALGQSDGAPTFLEGRSLARICRPCGATRGCTCMWRRRSSASSASSSSASPIGAAIHCLEAAQAANCSRHRDLGIAYEDGSPWTTRTEPSCASATVVL